MKRILLNVIATNKYVYFLDGIIESADNFFFKDNDITVMVHTNMDISAFEQKHKDKRVKILKTKPKLICWLKSTQKGLQS